MAAVAGSSASLVPVGEERAYWGAKVERREEIMWAGVFGRNFDRGSIGGDCEVRLSEGRGVARTCWTFLQPASWRRIEGHFMAALRSRWWRAVHDEGPK